MNQIERIQYFEGILDELEPAIGELERALEKYYKLQDKMKELEAYYDGPLWIKDYRDDEAGKFPSDLKRGILSEDGLYNLLGDNRRILEEIHSLCRQIQ